MDLQRAREKPGKVSRLELRLRPIGKTHTLQTLLGREIMKAKQLKYWTTAA